MPCNISDIQVSLISARNGEEYSLYRPCLASDNTMSASITSVAGEEFHVKLTRAKDTDMADGFCYKIWIDGRYMQGFVVPPSAKSATVEGVYEPAGVRPFVFTNLVTKEDDDEGHDFDVSKLGTIEIRVWRALVARIGNCTESPRRSMPVQCSLGPVSEKLKKVGWHGVSLGNHRSSKAVCRGRATYIDRPSKPYATFYFYYRPIDLLSQDRPTLCPEPFPVQSSPVVGKRTRDDYNEDGSQTGVDGAVERQEKRPCL